MYPPIIPRQLQAASLVAALFLAACGGKDTPPSPAGSSDKPAAVAGATPTGKVIAVQMITDDRGNRFEPAEIEAHPGDVVRFSVSIGVHNVHFLPDSNSGVAGLPEASDMLQLPGQTYDFPVNLAPGRTYYFQCDPHAALGMHGHLKVEGS